MRSLRSCTAIVSFVAGLAAYAPVAQAQPRKLYVWPTSPIHGTTVLDASFGGGPGDFSFGVYINTDRMPRGIGLNQWGQLGYEPAGQFSPPCVDEPWKCRVLPIFGGMPPNFTTWTVRNVSAAWDHTLALSDHPGLAFSRGLVGWGRNDFGQCDVPMFDATTGAPTGPWLIEGTAVVSKISAGEYVNIVLFNNGQIAAWGHMSRGVDPRSGTHPTNPDWNGFIPNDLWRFKDVAAGGHFVMALIKDAPGSGLPFDEQTQRTGEGWIISWGSLDYEAGYARGPGYRGYANGLPVVQPSPRNGEPNAPIAAVYHPPYDEIFGGHVVGGGIIRVPTDAQIALGILPGTIHLWGKNHDNVLTNQPANTTWEQMQLGYTQFACGVRLEDTQTGTPLHDLYSWGTGTPIGGFPMPSVQGYFKLLPGPNAVNKQAALCFNPNCDGSTGTPPLNANDFQCFSNAYAAASATQDMGIRRVSYANCDGSTEAPVLTGNDWICFANMYARGMCP
jgi:hypothetical protein